MKKTFITILPLIILIVCLAVCGVIFLINKKENFNFLNKETYSALLEMVDNQKDINNKLDKILDEDYSFDKAYVELNPYKISPLSAIIIFNTEDEEEIKLYINEEYVTTMDKTKKHVIPVYGLYEDYNNQVKLVKGEEEVIYEIKTEKSDILYPLEVSSVSDKINNQDIYFTVASYKTYMTGWDKTGKLRFYLTVDNRMDIEFLENGHFLIGTSQGQFAENFCAFVEMDYLGKIYNYYVPENGYSFEFQVLSNGNYMLAGGDKPVYVKEQLVYEINPKTGEKVSEINLGKIIKNIDPSLDEMYLGQKAIRNAFYYNEDTKELIMSFRGLDAVMSFNYETKQLNWVFADPKSELFNKKVWSNYLISLKSGRYPLGQHSVIITKEGYIGFLNNGYNRLHGFENGGNDLVSYYQDNYSSGEVYQIIDKEAELVFSYDGDKKYFSHQYGSINETKNDTYLIDFGYTLKDEYRLSKDGKLSEAESNVDNIYALIVEIDKDNNILFEAKSEEGKFRAFKHQFYNEITLNTNLNEFNIFNKVKKDNVEEISITKEELNEATEWIYDLQFTQNTFNTNYEIQESDEIKFIFINIKGEKYEAIYKEKDSLIKNRIFNIDLKEDIYSLYIEINGHLYNTLRNYQF